MKSDTPRPVMVLWQLMKMPSADELTIKTWYKDGGLRNQVLGPLLAEIYMYSFELINHDYSIEFIRGRPMW